MALFKIAMNWARGGVPKLALVSNTLKIAGRTLGEVGILAEGVQLYNGEMSYLEFGVDTGMALIGMTGWGAPIVLKSDGTTQEYLYLHRDYQGSIVAITNQAAVVVEKRLFDAWGQVLKVQDALGNSLAGFIVSIEAILGTSICKVWG